MADETKVEAKAAAEAPAKVAEAVAETVETVAKESAKSRQAHPRPTARQRQARRQAETTKPRLAAPRRTTRKTRTAARKTAAAAKQRTETVTNNNFFNGFDAIPAFAPFQNVFAEANERSQDLVKRSQKVAEELADLARANVEAVVEAGRVAAEGARTIGQNVVAKQRDGFEQAADAIRSLAEAKSPTEYLQLQSDFARASFDRCGRRELEADRVAGEARRRGVPAAFEPRFGQCRALQHPRCLTLSPPKVRATTVGGRSLREAAAIFFTDLLLIAALPRFRRAAIF